MRPVWRQLVLVIALALALLQIHAQTAGIDPALLARANGGDAAAQVAVGECYAAGKGVTKDLTQAAAWYRKAAEKGDLGGELHLAALYRDGGKGFPRDMAQAAAWYRKAAEQGDADAQATLGVLYSFGQGVDRNDGEAYFWLSIAALAKGPNQDKYAANRQMVGTHLTVDEVDEIQERVNKWQTAHPQPAASK